MKKFMLVAIMTVLAGNMLFSMEAEDNKSFITGVLTLPKDIRREIVYLSLQSEVGVKYELFKDIRIGSIVHSVAFSPDGKAVLVGSLETRTRLLDVETGQEIKGFELPYDFIHSVALSPDGTTVLTGLDDNTARLWDVETGKELQQFTGPIGSVNSVAFSPDGKTAFTGSTDVVSLWDINTGINFQSFIGHKSIVRSMACNPEGTTIVTGSWDGKALLWDATTGQQLKEFTYSGSWLSSIGARLIDYLSIPSLDSVTSVVFSPDGKTVLTGSYDGTACLWSAETGKELQQFKGHKDGVTSVAFSPDGKTILTGSYDKTARLWDRETGKELQKFTQNTSAVTSVAFNSRGNFIVIGSADCSISLWKIKYAFTAEQKKQAYALFKEKGLYNILKGATAQEERSFGECEEAHAEERCSLQ